MKVRFIGLVKIIHFDAVHAVLKHSSCVQKDNDGTRSEIASDAL